MSNEQLFSNRDDNSGNEQDRNGGVDNTSNSNGEDVNYLDMYVGEGKRYRDERELAKSKHFADEHIKRLEQENETYRREMLAKVALEEVVDKLHKTQLNASNHMSGNTGGERENEMNEEPGNPQSMTREQIDALVKQTLLQEQQKSRFDTNLDKVVKELESNWGPGYRSMMTDKAKQLGVTQEYLLELAGNSPDLFLNAVGVNPQSARRSNEAPPRSSFVSPASNSDGGKDWNYYEKMRKENSRQYYDPKVQAEIMDRLEKGTLVLPS